MMNMLPKKNLTASPIRSVEKEPSTIDIWTIWYAAQYGKLARVISLLDRQTVSSIDVQEFRTRWSPLHFACRYGHSNVVEFLVHRGANVDLPDWQGNTPLHVAAGWGNLKCVALVLEGGAAVRLKNNAGNTALDVAVTLGRKEHKRLLKGWKPQGFCAEELSEYRQQCIANNSKANQLERSLEEETNPKVRLELQALYFKRQSFGNSHPGLLATYGKLFHLYRKDGAVGKSLDMAEQGLTLCESIYTRNHTETAHWVTVLGEVFLLQENPEQAIHCLAEAYNTLVSLKGATGQETLVGLENLAIAYQQWGDLSNAEKHMNKLLEHLTERYGGGFNVKLFLATMRLATVLLDQKQVNEAQKLYTQCLVHAENLFGSVDEQTIDCTDALGKCYFFLGDFPTAEEYFKRSLSTLLRLPKGNDQPSRQEAIRRAHSNLAMVAIALRSAGAARQQLQLLGYIK